MGRQRLTLLIDLDGVIKSPEVPWLRTQCEALGHAVGDLCAEAAHYGGISAFDRSSGTRSDYATNYVDGFLRTLLPGGSHEQIHELRNLLFNGSAVRPSAPRCDAVTALRAWRARQVPVIVVTNNRAPGAADRLTKQGMEPGGPDGPVAVVESSLVGVAKPDPRIVGIALRHLPVGDWSTRMIGDSIVMDGGAARGAGLQFWHYDPSKRCQQPGHHHLARLEPELV